ncbi:hypothetical protein HBI60_253080 [Parastagonospora nodorum]|nr:hypothetical protein HBI51_247810 [Parastagonospora nodorum]KAH6383945.1 hypothetical protein HBI60_253080 [Parastagonospora nodorum]
MQHVDHHARQARTWGLEEEQKLVRRIDKRLMPLLVITYGLQYYDKVMLSQAALFGLREDLGLTVGDRYSLSSSIFYMGFLAGSFPAVLMAQRWPIDRVAGGTVLCWGICLMCSAACTSWQGFFVQRFFLGFLEAGVSPMFMLIVSNWYKKREQALRIGAWYSATGYAAAVSPLVNYGLGHITGGRLNSWQYMYIIAGTVTVLWSFVILGYLPSDPANVKSFSERERHIASSRLIQNNAGCRSSKLDKFQVWEAICDVKFWLLFSTAFLMMITNGPVSSFFPIIISGFGFNRLNALLLTLPAGIVIGTLELVVPYIAYRVSNVRTWLIVICQCGTIAASLLLWLLPRDEKGGLLFACYILASYSGGYAVLMGLQVANTAGYTKRSVTSAGIFVGYCLGNFVGPTLFKPRDAPMYAPGFIAVLATSTVAAVLAIVYRFICIRENRHRDESSGQDGLDSALADVGDKQKPNFKYVL